MLNKHYVDQNLRFLEEAEKFTAQVELSKKNVLKAKRKYFRKCQEKTACEQAIEIKIKQHQDGLIDFEQVQDIANRSINIKYKAEVSFQEYKQEVEQCNDLLSSVDNDYKPILTSLQKQEQRRIDYVKYLMEKLLSYYHECHTI